MSAWACWQQRRSELGWHGAWVKGLAGQLRGHQPGGRPEITNAQELGPSGGVLEHAAAALRGPDSGCSAAHSWGAADSQKLLEPLWRPASFLEASPLSFGKDMEVDI